MINNRPNVLWLSSLLAAAFLMIGPSEAKIIVKEKVTYYNVTGSNGKEIFRSMIQNGPKVGRRNDHALATTEYDYDIRNIKVAVKSGRCVLTGLEVHMAVKYTYPKWKTSSRASRETKAAWNRFEKTVVWHERQHVKIARDLAQDYEKALMKTRFRFRNDCDPNSMSLNWRVGLANIRSNRAQKKFDRQDLRPGGRGYEAQLRLLKAE